MAKLNCICKYCGVQFDRNAEPFVKVDDRRYAHASCAEIHDRTLTQEERDYNSLVDYIKKLFKEDTLNAKCTRQIREYKSEYKYTYSGMLKTLHWWFGINEHSIEAAQGGIGIVPYIYNDALKYFYNIYIAKQTNDNISSLDMQVEEIEIGPPKTRPTTMKLFNLEGEE